MATTDGLLCILTWYEVEKKIRLWQKKKKSLKGREKMKSWWKKNNVFELLWKQPQDPSPCLSHDDFNAPRWEAGGTTGARAGTSLWGCLQKHSFRLRLFFCTPPRVLFGTEESSTHMTLHHQPSTYKVNRDWVRRTHGSATLGTVAREMTSHIVKSCVSSSGGSICKTFSF